MILSGGELRVFIERPVSLTLLSAAVLLLCFTVVPKISKVRSEAFQEA